MGENGCGKHDSANCTRRAATTQQQQQQQQQQQRECLLSGAECWADISICVWARTILRGGKFVAVVLLHLAVQPVGEQSLPAAAADSPDNECQHAKAYLGHLFPREAPFNGHTAAEVEQRFLAQQLSSCNSS
jgi:hypothetical protein